MSTPRFKAYATAPGTFKDFITATISGGGGGPTFQNAMAGHNVNGGSRTYTGVTAELGSPIQAIRTLYNETWTGLDLSAFYTGGGGKRVGDPLRILCICTPSSWTPASIIAGTHDAEFDAVAVTADHTAITFWTVQFEVNSGANAAGNNGKQGYSSGSMNETTGVYTPGLWAQAMKHLNDRNVAASRNAYFRGCTAYFIAPQNGPASSNNQWTDAWLPPFAWWGDPFFAAGFDNYSNPGPNASIVAGQPKGYYATIGGHYPDPRDVVDRWYGLADRRGYTFEQGHLVIGETSTPQRTWDTDGSGQAACLTAYMDYVNSLPCPPYIINWWEEDASPSGYNQNWSTKAINAMKPYFLQAVSLVHKP